MLAYAFQALRQNNYEEIAAESFDDVYQLFAEILIKGVAFQLKQGLHKEYVPKAENLHTLHGKINIQNTFRNYLQQKRQITCEHDELSVNCTFNQILKTTMNVLLHTQIKPGQAKQLKNLLYYFAEVELTDVKNIKWNQLRFDRNSHNYQMLLYVCYFILNSILMTTDSGKYKMRGLSDDKMCRLFEKFVLEYYHKEHPETRARAAQIDWNIDKNNSTTDILPILQTDIYLQRGNRKLIIDTKYYSKTMQKHFDKKTIHSNNLNQILVYTLNEDAHQEVKGTVDGMLLYAKTDEDIIPDGQMKWKDGNIIYFRTLDLGVDFELIKKQLDDFLKI